MPRTSKQLHLWIYVVLAVCPLLVTDCWVTELATWAEPIEPCLRRGNELSEIGRYMVGAVGCYLAREDGGQQWNSGLRAQKTALCKMTE